MARGRVECCQSAGKKARAFPQALIEQQQQQQPTEEDRMAGKWGGSKLGRKGRNGGRETVGGGGSSSKGMHQILYPLVAASLPPFFGISGAGPRKPMLYQLPTIYHCSCADATTLCRQHLEQS